MELAGFKALRQEKIKCKYQKEAKWDNVSPSTLQRERKRADYLSRGQ